VLSDWVSDWTCPFCGRFTTINSENRTWDHAAVNHRSKHGKLAVHVTSTTCPNPACKELAMEVAVRTIPKDSTQFGITLLSKQLWPEANVMVVPDHIPIPESIKKTYREACLVAAISGAASAALSRRCLQGIVRDFFDIPKNRRGDLGAELAFVKDQIDPQVWDDIQAVRAVGDIGAHMDKNVDVIVDVEPREADLLIKLIEELFKGWYIDRERRKGISTELHELLGIKRGQQRAAKAVRPQQFGGDLDGQEEQAQLTDGPSPDAPQPQVEHPKVE
jgi:hypothetical protein